MYLSEYKFMIESDNALWIIQLQPEIDTLIPPRTKEAGYGLRQGWNAEKHKKANYFCAKLKINKNVAV